MTGEGGPSKVEQVCRWVPPPPARTAVKALKMAETALFPHTVQRQKQQSDAPPRPRQVCVCVRVSGGVKGMYGREGQKVA